MSTKDTTPSALKTLEEQQRDKETHDTICDCGDWPHCGIETPAHTSGPWKFDGVDEVSPDKELIVRHPDGSVLCRVTHRYKRGEHFTAVHPTGEANARLIAAAPDLLQACKDAVYALNAIPNRRISVRIHKNTYSVCSLLDSVIGKAEGR